MTQLLHAAQRRGVRGGPISGANSHALDVAIRQVEVAEAGLDIRPFAPSELRVDHDRVIAGPIEYRLSPDGLRRFCGWVGAPANYLTKLDSDIRSRLLQFHVDSRDYHRAPRRLTDANTAIISRAGEFINLVRSDLALVPSTAVLGALKDGVGNDAASLRIQRFAINDERMQIDVVSPIQSEEVRPGDVVEAGIRMSHSMVGEFATSVSSYIHRLVCANGMTHRECLGRQKTRTRRLGDQAGASQQQVEQIRRLVAMTWEGLHEKLAAIKRLQDQPIDDVEQGWRPFLTRARMNSNRIVFLLRQAWHTEGREPTAFGMLNALTRVATHATEVSAMQRGILERLAGVMAMADVHLCPRCFNFVSERAVTSLN